jgi:hypothetical protein
MHNDPRPSSHDYERELKEQSRQDTAGVSGEQLNKVMDKRVIVDLLHQKARLMQQQANGLRRLADLVQATTDHDYPLFTILLAMVKA